MSEVGDIATIVSVVFLVLFAVRLDRRFSPSGIAKLGMDAYQSFRMSVTGKEGVYSKKKAKLNTLMTNFMIEEVTPEIAQSMLPGIPPSLIKMVMHKVNDSELGDFLKESPEMIPDAFALVSELFANKAISGGDLSRPDSTVQRGW